MRREIRRTRTFGSSQRRRYGDDYDRDRDRDEDYQDKQPTQRDDTKPTKSTKKKSPWGIIIIVVIVIAVIYFATRGSSESTNQIKQTNPESVVKAVIAALGQNNKTTAKNYVAAGDSTVTAQVDTLFNNYSGYFTYEDDYINFFGMNYSLTSQSETEAKVTIAGQADIVEVSYDIYEDEWGDEVEDEVEAVVDEFTFTDIQFSLKKTGDSWYLSQVPSKIF